MIIHGRVRKIQSVYRKSDIYAEQGSDQIKPVLNAPERDMIKSGVKSPLRGTATQLPHDSDLKNRENG